MTDATEQEFIRNLPQIVIAVGVVLGTVFSYLNGRKLTAVRKDVDGKMQELVNAATGKATAEEKVKGMETAKQLKDSESVPAAGGLPDVVKVKLIDDDKGEK